jgi:hypothetical protein
MLLLFKKTYYILCAGIQVDWQGWACTTYWYNWIHCFSQLRRHQRLFGSFSFSFFLALFMRSKCAEGVRVWSKEWPFQIYFFFIMYLLILWTPRNLFGGLDQIMLRCPNHADATYLHLARNIANFKWNFYSYIHQRCRCSLVRTSW